MAGFQTELSAPQPYVAIEQGVPDQSKAALLEGFGEIAGVGFASKVLTDFSNEMESIVQGNDSGSITTSEARTRADSVMKKYTNQHPYLSSELRSQLASLKGVGSSLFPQTSEEKIQYQVALDEAKFQQQQRQDAEKVGLTLDAYRAQQHQVNQWSQIEAENRARIAQGEANNTVITEGLESGTNLINSSVRGRVLNIIKDKGGLTGDDLVELKTTVRSNFSALRNHYREASGSDVDVASKKAALAALDKEEESLINLLNDGTLSQALSENTAVLEQIIKKQALVSNTDLALVKAAGGDAAVQSYLQTLARPELAQWVQDNDPQAAFYVNAKTQGKYIADSIARIFGESAVDLTPGQQSFTDKVATNSLVSAQLSDEQSVKVGEYLASRANDVGIEAFSAWDTDAVQRKVNRSPAQSAALSNAYSSLVANLSFMLPLNQDSNNYIGGLKQFSRREFDGLKLTIPFVEGGGQKPDRVVTTWEFTNKFGVPIKTLGQDEQQKLRLLINLARRYPKEVRGGKSMEEWGAGIVQALKPIDTTSQENTSNEESSKVRTVIRSDSGKLIFSSEGK